MQKKFPYTVVNLISGEYLVMDLKESGAYCKVEEDKEVPFKQFTQCHLPLDTQWQYRAAKWDTEQEAER